MRRLAALALVLLVLVGGATAVVGAWLVVADPLEPAAAIVVLGGHVPFRAMEAAALYRERWAPDIWLLRAASPAEEAALTRLGIEMVGEEAYNRQVLERLGVPSSAIRVLPDRIRNTLEEVRSVHAALRRIDAPRIIIVTSKAHTRRVRATWAAVAGDSRRAVVRYAREDPYDPWRWWRHTRDAHDVTREVLGLFNVWAGFPVQPDRR